MLGVVKMNNLKILKFERVCFQDVNVGLSEFGGIFLTKIIAGFPVRSVNSWDFLITQYFLANHAEFSRDVNGSR